MDVPKKEKCPYCNRLMNSIDYSAGIKNLTLARSKNTVTLIRKVLEIIHRKGKNPVEQSQYYMLLNETKDISASIIKETVDTFITKKHIDRGHGVHYLLKMIQGINSTKEMKEQYERKTLDRLPPIKEYKND